MDDFVKKQLHHIGFKEKTHPEIFLAFKDFNEADFRGLTVQKIRHKLPNKPDFQMEILCHIETLRVNLALTFPTPVQASNASSDTPPNPENNDKETVASSVVINEENIKSEVNYSSGSDVEILSSSEEDQPETETPIAANSDSDDSIIIENLPKRKKLKRIDQINIADEPTPSPSPIQTATLESSLQPQSQCPSISTGAIWVTSGPSIRLSGHQCRFANEKSSSVDSRRGPAGRTNQTQETRRKPRNPKARPTKMNIYRDMDDEYRYTRIEGAEINLWYGTIERAHRLTIQDMEVRTIVGIGRFRKKFVDWAQFNNQVKSLKELNLWSSNLRFTVRAASESLVTILKTARNLQIIRISFKKAIEIEHILNLIIRVCEDDSSSFRNLREFCIMEDNHVKDPLNPLGRYVESLDSTHLLLLTKVEWSSLSLLELNCGLKNITKESFESVLNRFSGTLQVLNCPGKFTDSPQTKYFTIEVPKMDRLTYFFLGEEEFTNNGSDVNSGLANANIELINLEGMTGGVKVEPDLSPIVLTFGLKFPHIYPNLEIIHVGNKCIFEDLHFFNFPNLNTFSVRGPWDRMFKFPKRGSRRSIYPNMKYIQFPDLLANIYFISNVVRLFPNLKTVWMWLPSRSVLDAFLKQIVHSKLNNLYLKTNFCFSMTFQELLIGRHRANSRVYSELYSLRELMKYKYWKEYVSAHNIDIPPDILNLVEARESDKVQIVDEGNPDDTFQERIDFFNNTLKRFQIDHIGRVLQIPKGNIHFQDPKCDYCPRGLEIGYPMEYPFFTDNTKIFLPDYEPSPVRNGTKDLYSSAAAIVVKSKKDD